MDPLDEFHEATGLFAITMVAHMARILDRAGLLDDATRRLIHGGLHQLSEIAERCPGEEQIPLLVDQWVGILPPGTP